MSFLSKILASPLKNSAMTSSSKAKESGEHNESYDAQASQNNKPRQASPSGGASPNEQSSPNGTKQPAVQSVHKALVTRQPDTSDQRTALNYKGQQWEYTGHQWDEEGILSLKLATLDSVPELVREAKVQSDNPETIFALWHAINRPNNKHNPGYYEPFAILGHRQHGRGKRMLVQWVGFKANAQDTTWMSKTAIAKAAPGILQEYWANLAPIKRERMTHGRVNKTRAPLTKSQRPQRSQRRAKHRL